MTRPSVLVVDDDEGILELMRDVLSDEYKLVTVDSAAEALQLLDRQDFELVIIDLGMPGVSGVDAIQRIRSDGRKQDLRILVVSAYTELRRLIGGQQVDGVLAKPFSLAQLEARVAELVDKRGSEGGRRADGGGRIAGGALAG